MPELPEVETLRSQLAKILPGARIVDVRVLDTARLPQFKGIKGRQVVGVRREGKFLRIILDGAKELRIHLRMSGHLRWFAKEESLPGHSRFLLLFSHGRLCLVDPRRFATVELKEVGSKLKQGRDVFCADTINPADLQSAAAKRKIPVKNFLLDQKAIAGIGNIYACEVLYLTGVDPWKKASEVSLEEWSAILGKLRPILKKAITCRGTSVSDWRDLFGHKGTYQEHLNVYRKEGRACPRCATPIRREPQGGRSTFYCPKCQGLKSGSPDG